MLDNYVKFPARTWQEWAGFALAVVAVVAIARRVPVVSKLTK